jgi:hypothetical protein
MDLRKFDRFLAIMHPEDAELPKVIKTNAVADIPGAQPNAFGKLK